MKILWIAHFLPWPPHGGSPQRNYNLLKELRKEFDVYKIGFIQRPHHSSDIVKKEAITRISEICNGLQAFNIPSDYSRLSWYSLLSANVFSQTPYSAWRFKSKEFENHLNNLLDRERFDIVYSDTAATAHYALRAKGKAKLVLNHHNIESSLLFRRAENATNLFSRCYLRHQANKLRKWESRICPQFDVNLTVSEVDANELRNFAPGIRCEIIANGSDIEYFSPSDSVAGYEMVYAGGGTWLPNRDAMTWFVDEIFPKIVKRVPDAIMHIIGRNPPKEVRYAAEKDSHIKVHGFVDDIRPYLARSAVYVAPIRIGGGTRLKILDAFASGKAVVSTSIGCEGIECEDRKHIRIVDNSENFSEAVVELLQDSQARQRLEKNARDLVEKTYSWQIIGEQLRSLYRELVARK